MSSDFEDRTAEEQQAIDTMMEAAAAVDSPEDDELVEEEKLFSEDELNQFWISVMNGETYGESNATHGMEYELQAMTDRQKRETERFLDKLSVRLARHYDIMESRCLTVMSIRKFGKLEFTEKDSLADRLTALDKYPVFAVDLMSRVTAKFNRKVSQMTEEIAKANF